MCIYTNKRTAIVLTVVLVARVISANFNGCDGQDFVSRQCAEDGETIAPLLTEHQHPTTENSDQHTISASIKTTKNVKAEDLPSITPLKEQNTPSRDDKIKTQFTSRPEKSLKVQTQLGSTSESKETSHKITAAPELGSLKKQNQDTLSKSSNKLLQTSSNPTNKLRKHQQDIKHEISSPYSAKLNSKPSSQSFTEKLHQTVTKSNRASASTANAATTKPKNNEASEKERSTVQSRNIRSLPATDNSKISQSSMSSNSLKIQSPIKETSKDKSTEKSVIKEVNVDQNLKAFSQNKLGSKVPETGKGTLQKNIPQEHSIKYFLSNQKQQQLEPPKLDKVQSALGSDMSINIKESNTAKSAFTTKGTSGSGTSIPKDFKGSIKSNVHNRIRRSVFEEEKSPFSEAVTMATTATISEAAEQGFTTLQQKCDLQTSCATPEVEELVKHSVLEEPGVKLATENNENNNGGSYKTSKTAEPQDRIIPTVEYDKLLSPDPQHTITKQKSNLDPTQSTDVTSTPTSDASEPVMTVSAPKAESLVSNLHHEHRVDISSEWKDFPGASEVETLQLPVAIRMDNRDREVEYGVNEERSRPAQRLPVPKLAFPDVPPGESFHIQDLGLSEGLFVFSYLSSFLSWIQPYDFPVELLRDALWKRVSVVDLITESLQVEAGFITCLTIGVLLALGVPCILLIHACCRAFGSSGSNDSWNEQEGVQAENCAGNCRRVTLVFIMQLVLVLLVAGIISMFVTNEQMSHAVEQTPTAVHTALNDVNTFLRNSHQQLRFVVTKTLDQAVDAIVTDLDNIEELLGRPIQNQIATETGVDIALDALLDFTADAREISAKVEELLSNAASTRDLIVETRERLADLRLQVDLFRRQCSPRFRSLCDTVDTAGLDVVLRIESLLTEQRLTRVRDLKNGNLTLVAQQARGEFQYIPLRVEKETKDSRLAIKRHLARQKEVLYDSAWSLDVVSRDLTYRVEEARNTAMQIVRGMGEVEQWRWLTGLGAASSVLFLWLLLLSGVTCGCCGVEGRAGSTLLASVVLMSIFSVGLWALALSALLVGGHGEVFICRPLYDEPGYTALTRLVDRPGVLFQRSSGGFFSNLLYGNGTLDVPLRDVLEECQADGPAYRAFRLHQVFDVDLLSDHRRWDNLHSELRRLRVDLSDMRLLTPELQAQLQEMLMATTVNLTNFRAQISRQVTGRDLGSFADQLTSVANQITDLSTLSRIENLASRTRRLLLSHIQPLEQRKEDLVYQLTALEVQMAPLQRQVNQSLSHLRTIQFFIDNKAGNISAQKSEEYTARLIGYMDQFRDHVLNTTKSFVAPCRPIWNLYHAMRVLFCRHVMDPLNGFWFATVWCLVLFMVATPPCLKLVDHYRHLKMQHQHNSSLLNPSTESPSETLMISDQGGNWSTPGSGEAGGW